jgi:broad specificity phosphatase PhoE
LVVSGHGVVLDRGRNDFGSRYQATWQEIREQKPEIVSALVSNHSEFPRYPGEEGRGPFRERVCAALAEIADRHSDDKAVAVVTHAGPIVVYVMETIGRGYSRPILRLRTHPSRLSSQRLGRRVCARRCHGPQRHATEGMGDAE